MENKKHILIIKACEYIENNLSEKITLAHLTNKPKVYHFNKTDFIMRLNGDIVEMSLADEAPVFPILAFRELSSAKTDLLYYRIGEKFRTKLLDAI